MSFTCRYCGHLCKTEAGQCSHVKQTLCNYKPGLVPLSTLAATITSENPSIPSTPPSPSPGYDSQGNSSMESFMDVDSGEATSGPCTIHFPGAGKVVSWGATYLDNFNDDRFSEERKENLYYPFSSRPEWEMASFLLNSSLSMQEIDHYLQLELVGLALYLYDLLAEQYRQNRIIYHSRQHKDCMKLPTFFLLFRHGEREL